MAFLVEIGTHDGSSEGKLFYSTEGYQAKPSDIYPNQFYDARLPSAGSIERHMFSGGDGLSGGTTSGTSSVGVGSITINNGAPYDTDEYVDDIRALSVRDVTIKRVVNSTDPLSSATTLFVGRASQIDSTRALENINISIHDRLQDLNKPLLVSRYAGTSTSTGMGIEGEADLKDKIKPKLWGRRNNIPVIAVNVYDLMYQISDGAIYAVSAVYDGGIALTNVGNYGNVAALRSASVLPGQYATCVALGIIKLGGQAFGDVTCDATEGATLSDRTAGQIVDRMLAWLQDVYPDVTVSLETGTVAALDALNDAECGIYIPDEQDALQAISSVLNSIGGWILPVSANDSDFQVGRFDLPGGAAVASFDIDDNVGGTPDLVGTSDGGSGIPVYKVIVNYDRIGVVQSGNQLFGDVSTERRSYLGDEWRQAVEEDLSVLTQYPNASTLTINSALLSQTDAAAEASRLLAIHSVRNEIVRMKLDYDDALDCDIGAVVELRSRHGRLGLGTSIGAGRKYRVIGRVDDLSPGPTITLDMWGRVSG